MKKILSIILTMCMLLSVGAVVSAEETPLLISPNPNAVEEIEATLEGVSAYGKIPVYGEFVAVEDNQITIKSEEKEMVLNLFEDTPILNADGTPTSVSEIKKNSKIFAMVSDGMTMSLPPQSAAYIVMVSEDEVPAFPIYVEVKDIATDPQGNTLIKSGDANYVIMLNADTEILPVKSRKIVTVQDITVGSKLLVYSDIMTMSLPALVNPTKILVFEPEINAEKLDALKEEMKETFEEMKEQLEAEASKTVTQYDKFIVNGKFVRTENNQIVMEDGEEFIVNTNSETVFMNADGTPTSIENIKEGSYLQVIANTAVTLSIPAQSYGYVVMVSEDEVPAFPIYVEVDEIKTDDSGNTVYASADGQYEVIPSETTEIAPFKNRKIVTFADVKYGSELIVFSETATMSIPAKTNPTKVILLEERPVTYTEGIFVNGNSIDMTVVKAENGSYLLPVRFVAEALGLEVGWDNALRKVTVGTVPMGVNFTIGENSYNKARMTPFVLSSEPVLIDSRTYVPLDFFTEVLEAKVKVVDGVIAIFKN